MNDSTDGQLLRRYAEHRTESAFEELVRRHLDFVYSAALRMVCDPHLAEDVTQSVFVALANVAASLADRANLCGWLHQTAQNIAAQTVRTIERRRAREQETATMNQLLSSDSEMSWVQIAPHLDAALGELGEPDRHALLLRYFKNYDLRAVGVDLGISEDAAQKRVSRAVERLREFLAKRGVTAGAGGLAIILSANAVQAAPTGLATTITCAAMAGTSVSTSTAIAVTKTIVMTTLQKAIITSALVAVASAGIFEVHQAARLREQNQTLRRQQAPLTEQIEQLQRERDEATNLLAGIREENAQLHQNTPELLKLRGEVGALRTELAAKTSMTSGGLSGTANNASATQLKNSEVWNLLTPTTLKDKGISTPEATVQTEMWALLGASSTNLETKEASIDRLREITSFQYDFDPRRYSYTTIFGPFFDDTKFMRISSVTYPAPDKASVWVEYYGDESYKSSVGYNLVRESDGCKLIP